MHRKAYKQQVFVRPRSKQNGSSEGQHSISIQESNNVIGKMRLNMKAPVQNKKNESRFQRLQSKKSLANIRGFYAMAPEASTLEIKGE